MITTTITVTGDRSYPIGLAIPIVQQVLLQNAVAQAKVGAKIRVVVGLDSGVEAAVRVVAKAAGIELVDLQHATKDWDDYAQRLKHEGVEGVLFLHGQPEASKLYPAITKVFSDDEFEMVDPSLLFV